MAKKEEVDKRIGELSREMYKNFNKHEKEGGFLMNDTRAVSEIAVEKWLEEHFMEMVSLGRVSVLQDFKDMCSADAFVGFTAEEWKAIKKFFAYNEKISGWSK